MHIAALQKTTLLDYPGRIACTVFLSGCNLRCPFCHNAGLVLPEQKSDDQMTPDELLEFLRTRQGKLDGVCITGGEPTLQKDLPELITQIRQLGFLVKLDTNGSNPAMLRMLLQQHMLDYVAMDIKNSPDRYREICGGVDILPQVRESVRLLMAGDTEYEFRTTVSHPWHDSEAVSEIARWLAGARQYFLQCFVDSGNLVGSGSSPMTEEEMYELQQAAAEYIPNTRLRGMG